MSESKSKSEDLLRKYIEEDLGGKVTLLKEWHEEALIAVVNEGSVAISLDMKPDTLRDLIKGLIALLPPDQEAQ